MNEAFSSQPNTTNTQPPYELLQGEIFFVLQGISMLFVIKQLHTKGIYETTTAQFKIDIGKR